MIYNGNYATPRPDLGAAYKEYMEDPDEFIALMVAPEFPVDVEEGTFSVITRESLRKTVDDKRNANGSFNQIEAGAEDKTFKTYARGLEAAVDYRKRSKFQKDFDLDMIKLEQLVHQMKLRREIRIASLLFNATTWTGAALATDVSGAPWDSASSGKPITNVQAAKKAVYDNGGDANAVILPYSQFLNCMVSDQILARFPGINRLTPGDIKGALAALFDVKHVFVGKARKDTADEGQAAVNAQVWSDDYVLVCRVAEQGAPPSTPCVARSQRWVLESPEEMVIEQYYEPQTLRDKLRARNDVGEKVMDVFEAHLLQVDAL